jgi:hypothetical protein
VGEDEASIDVLPFHVFIFWQVRSFPGGLRGSAMSQPPDSRRQTLLGMLTSQRREINWCFSLEAKSRQIFFVPAFIPEWEGKCNPNVKAVR